MRFFSLKKMGLLILVGSFAAVPACGYAQSSADAAPIMTAALPAELTLQRLVSHLLSVNKNVLSKRYESGIVTTGIDRAEAAFQPQVTASVTNGNSIIKNNAEDKLIRSNLDTYRKSSTDYSVAVSKLFSPGTKVEAKTTMSRFMTNLLENQSTNQGDNYRAYYGLSVTQPLARDFGPDVTRAKVRLAELDTTSSELGARDTASTVTAEGILTYLDLSLAQERVATAEERIQVGNRLLAQANDLLKQGRLPMSDVWEVESSLLRYASALSEAKQQLRERVNKLRTMLMATSATVPEMLKATEPLPEQSAEPVLPEQSLKIALEKRDDFRMRRTMADREGVQFAYSKNQTLPRIDLIASYGLNGLSYSYNDAYLFNSTRDFPTWSVGFQMNFPLGENRQAKADMITARIRQEDALLSLHALEVSIANDIDTSVGLLNSSAERWVQMRDAAFREQQQLDLERKRLAAGRSGMREILFREERALSARFAVTEQQVAYARAEALLQAAQGTLLERFSKVQ
jgi:outer membrane protein TolC